MISIPGVRYIEEEQPDTEEVEPPLEEESPAPPPQEVPEESEEIPGVRFIQPEENEEIIQSEEKEPLGIIESFKKGHSESVYGALDQLLFGNYAKKDQSLIKDPSFLEGVAEGAGTLYGDFPFIVAGGIIGATLLAETGVGAVVGAGVGGTALPAFLKESMRQYREHQESGEDLTFGEFIERAGKVSGTTLSEGALGATLSTIQKTMPLLRKIPYLNNLFNTKYVGKPILKATELGIEGTTAATLPAISQGRIPDPQDVAKATLLFAGQRVGHLPGQLPNIIKNFRSRNLDIALADKIQSENLAYPPLQEFKEIESQMYKNNIELDKNIAAFDESVIKNITDKVNALSPDNLESTHDAGNLLKSMLIGEFPVTHPETPAVDNPPTQQPARQPIPLILNPMMAAIETISPAEFNSGPQAGATIRHVFQANRAADKSVLTQRYDDLGEVIQGYEIIDTVIPERVQEFIDQFEGSAVPGSKEAQLLHQAEAIRDMFILYDEEGDNIGVRNVNVGNLIKSNRSIKQIPNWEIAPTMSENLSELTNTLDGFIGSTLESVDPVLSEEYFNLNRDYANFKRRYDNSETRIFFKRTEKSEAIYKKFSGFDSFTQLAEALETSPEGEHVLNMMRRDIWQNKIGRRVFEATTDEAFSDAIGNIENRQINDLMTILEPRQQATMTESVQRSNQLREATRQAQEQSEAAPTIQELRRLEKSSNAERVREIQDKQNLLVSILAEDPAKLVQNLRTVEGIKRTWSALESIPGGREARNALAKFETQEMLSFLKDGYIRTGRVPYKDLSVKLQNKDFRAKIQALNGNNFVRDLDILTKITNSLSEQFHDIKIKYKNDPSTLASAFNIATALGITSGDFITPIIMQGVKKTGLKGLNKVENMWLNKKNYDQENIHQALAAARALKSGNKAEIKKQAMIFAPISTSSPEEEKRKKERQ